MINARFCCLCIFPLKLCLKKIFLFKKQIFFTVYGLLNTQTCSKYILSNDEPNDAHFFSHVDGSLHVKSFKTPFTNDDYCVEYVEMGTVDVSKS